MTKEKQMCSRKQHFPTRRVASLLALFCTLTLLPLAAEGSGQGSGKTAAQSQKTFSTANDAADALIKAAGVFDVSALMQILGPDGKNLVSSEDPIRDKDLATAFAAKAHEKKSIAVDPKNASRAFLVVGDEEWPWPVPIVKRNGKWSFDTKAGLQEIIFRRIGSNELDAIQICRGYVDAQRAYALEKHDGSEVNQYSQRIISTPGKRDGLVWREPDGSLGGPISVAIAEALQQGYSDRSQPYHGYYFKILKGQGPAAPLGRLDFVVEGAMIGGFALAAAPADYRVTGVKSFIVSYQGIVYEKDLGPDTLKIFRNMDLFNPDKTWKPTNDNWQPSDLGETSATEPEP